MDDNEIINDGMEEELDNIIILNFNIVENSHKANILLM